MSAQNLEMNDVKIPLMAEGDVEKTPEVDFKGSKQDFHGKKENEFHGLTKEELEKFAKDPFWRKIRIILFVIFWVVWVGMLIAAILIVIMSPKCPKRPKLEFWEQKTGYWLDPFAFVDTDNNGVGDFKGIMSKLDYIEKQLGAGYIILDPIFKGQYSSRESRIGLVESFRELDPQLGSKESFLALIKEARKRGIEIVLAADFNALSVNSTFIKNDIANTLIPWSDKFSSWVNRKGDRPVNNFMGTDVYSAVDSQLMLELNLQNSAVLKELKESVKLWLDSGIRGFLLTNIAMYVENPNISATNTDYAFNNTWYKKRSLNGQIYSTETLTFLKEIRKIMDDVAKSTDKSRLLIVDAGDIGYGLEQTDDMLQYLGEKEKYADMIIGREFLKNRGWKINTPTQSSVRNYMNMVPSNKRKRVALASATSTNIRLRDLLNLASPFLTEGNSILYYGSELGIDCETDISTIDSLNLPFYPKNKVFPQIIGELPTKCNHMIMPWDNSGKGFYSNNNGSTNEYITNAKVTVQGLTAVGMGETILHLHQKLIKLRKEQSFQSGNISMFFEEKTSSHSYEIFTRKEEGFPIMIVALLRDRDNNGKVFSFNSICSKVTPLLVYPSNANLPENVEIESKNIYLQILKAESIHVFKCV